MNVATRCRKLLVALALGAVAAGCRPVSPAATDAPPSNARAAHPVPPGPEPTAPPSSDLNAVLDRALVRFTPPALPTSVLDHLASHRVVMIGEYHQLREHQDFLVTTLEALHGRGTRLLLLEGFQAESWLVDQFVAGDLDALSPSTDKYFGYLLESLRTLNTGLAKAERFRVATIDINHRPWALPLALHRMLASVGPSPCVSSFLKAAGWRVEVPIEQAQAAFEQTWKGAPDAYQSQLVKLRDEVDDGSCFAHAAGSTSAVWKHELPEMVDIALQSLAIRKVWDTDGEHSAHPMREEVIKAIVDRRIGEARGPVLINAGGYHAQRRHVMGTPKKWLAEHLASPESASGGSFYSVYVSFVRAQQQRGAQTVWFDATQDTPPGELLSEVARLAGQGAAFLPLGDPHFRTVAIPVNYMGHVVSHEPGLTFDAYVLLPKAHLVTQ